MIEKIRMPCGRSSWCGRTSCRHAELCRQLAADIRASRGSNPGAAPPASEAAAPRAPLAAPSDIVYLYDGSLPGFYCCVYHSVYQHQLPAAIYRAEEAQPTLFPQRFIDTDDALAERVRRSIPQKISERAEELVQKCFLSYREDRELPLLRFLLLGYQLGGKVSYMFGHADVAPVLEMEKHLGGEAHLLKGFVRFSDYDGVLAATISPKNFILPFLAHHFCTRYSQEDFIIYDKVHKAALIYEKRQSRIVPLQSIDFPQADETELQYRALWKQFYNTIAIEARTNPRCRMTHMPKRYWENMLEVADLL